MVFFGALGAVGKLVKMACRVDVRNHFEIASVRTSHSEGDKEVVQTQIEVGSVNAADLVEYVAVLVQSFSHNIGMDHAVFLDYVGKMIAAKQEGRNSLEEDN